jgi:ubiquitin-activating enzyme E1
MFALIGLGTNEKGKIICTDDDNIEISNLNRQFLFRQKHIGSNKSLTACSIAKNLNE